jgi:uncharacterized membrane protein
MMEGWITYSLAGMVLLGLMNYTLKLFVDGYQPLVAAFLVQGISAVFLLALILKGGMPTFEMQMLKYAVPAALFSALALYFLYGALKMGNASKVIAIINLNTLVVVVLAAALLKEGITLKAGLGIAFGILSILLLSA